MHLIKTLRHRTLPTRAYFPSHNQIPRRTKQVSGSDAGSPSLPGGGPGPHHMVRPHTARCNLGCIDHCLPMRAAYSWDPAPLCSLRPVRSKLVFQASRACPRRSLRSAVSMKACNALVPCDGEFHAGSLWSILLVGFATGPLLSQAPSLSLGTRLVQAGIVPFPWRAPSWAVLSCQPSPDPPSSSRMQPHTSTTPSLPRWRTPRLPS